MKIVAIIPARGGSKGIPRKNLQKVNGRSLIHRTIAVAMEAPRVDAVFVSTDDPSIQDEAVRVGAQIVHRPPGLATDSASSEAALLHALEELRGHGIHPMFTVLLQCTSPFTTAADVEAVVSAVADNGADSAFTATPFHGFVWQVGTQGMYGVNHDARHPRQRRQDRPSQLLETGAVYAFRTGAFLKVQSRFCGRTEAVEVDTRRALEIDQPADLEIANALAVLLDRDTMRARLSAQAPRVVALDFDGVLTDNRVITNDEGQEAVICHRGDGHGLAQLSKHVPIIVLSTEVNPVVSARCRKLGIDCLQGLGDTKFDALKRYSNERGLSLHNVLFLGNDVNDVECLEAVGTAVAVADAVPEVLAVSNFVLSRPGGHGAVRELCDLLLPLYTGHNH